MKRCPQCGREYDPSMTYCLDDGAELLYGPASMDEPATAILPPGASTAESPTRTLDPGEAEATKLYGDQPENATTQPASRKATVISGIVGALVIAALAIGGYWFYGRGSSEQIGSIAVMPFVNESGSADVEYLSDGMTEALISSLTEIPGLSVKARSTVFYYKGKDMRPKKIGEDLGVEAVLLGRVVQRGEDLKLSLELVDTESQDAIWSKSYDRKMSDLVTLQSEVARNVLDQLRAKLSSTEQEKVAKTYTTNPEAHQLYLKGRFYWNKRSVEDFGKAEEYFKQAIELDPGYALAYSGLADTYSLMPTYGDFLPEEYRRKAEMAARKALELDDQLAEAHTSLAAVWMSEYDWKKAESELRKAIELNPNYAPAHHWLAENLALQGRTDEAIAEIDRALKIDPYSPVINRFKGFVFESAGRYDEAIAQGEKTVELFPDFAEVHINLGRYYAAKKNFDKAEEEHLKGWELSGEPPEEIQRFKSALEKDGWMGLWKARLTYELGIRDAALAKDSEAYFNLGGLAWIYVVLGEKEKALENLNKAYEQREPALAYLLASRDFSSINDDPRFKELIKKVGLRR